MSRNKLSVTSTNNTKLKERKKNIENSNTEGDKTRRNNNNNKQKTQMQELSSPLDKTNKHKQTPPLNTHKGKKKENKKMV